jgi:hypothetical protein
MKSFAAEIFSPVTTSYVAEDSFIGCGKYKNIEIGFKSTQPRHIIQFQPYMIAFHDKTFRTMKNMC